MARAATVEKAILGDEPEFSGPCSRADIIRTYNYYSYRHTIGETRKWIIAWMKTNGYSAAQMLKYNASNDSRITQTKASIARMLSRGLEDQLLEEHLIEHIDEVLSATQSRQNRTVVQIKTRQRMNQVIADLDDMLDEFYQDNYREVFEIELEADALPTDIKAAHQYYTELLAEITEHGEYLKKAQQKRYIQVLQGFLDALALKGATAKRRAPVRKKRKPDASKIVAKVKYLANHGNYASVDPVTILDSNIVWVYNVKTRKLAKYVAEPGKKLTVSGSTLKGIAKSEQYTLRKPDDILPTIVTGGRRQVDKIIKTITTKPSVPNGRINDQTMIMRVFK